MFYYIDEKMMARKLNKPFHYFLICFALWAYGLLAIFYGLKNIKDMIWGSFGSMPVEIILSILLIIVGIDTFKACVDLASFRMKAISELRNCGYAACAIFIGFHLDELICKDECCHGCILKAILCAAWGFALYKYYGDRRHLFQ